MKACRKQIRILYRLIENALLSGAVGKGGRTSGHSTGISPKGCMNSLKALEHSTEVWYDRVLLSEFHCMFWFKASGFDLTFCLVELKLWDSQTDETASECVWSSRTAMILCSGIKLCALAQMVSLNHVIEVCEFFFSFLKTHSPWFFISLGYIWATSSMFYVHTTCAVKIFGESMGLLFLLAVSAACLMWQKGMWQGYFPFLFACKKIGRDSVAH